MVLIVRVPDGGATDVVDEDEATVVNDFVVVTTTEAVVDFEIVELGAKVLESDGVIVEDALQNSY